ncbi:MAG TPA: single-stranded DNA-binding protein [Candidatus Omnitrophota bacterium]|nr:single-stranded DNA-binding protein [Candidatus Omnitrophota bacterium]
MAASMNKVFLMGNLTRDPELRYIPSGTAVANFSLAINRPYKDASGEKKEEVSYVRVEVWGKMAEVCGEYLSKGRPVLVEGRLKSRSWETPDGQKRNSLDVVATSVQFLGSKNDRQEGRQGKGFGARDADSAQGVESIDLDEQGNTEEDVPF